LNPYVLVFVTPEVTAATIKSFGLVVVRAPHVPLLPDSVLLVLLADPSKVVESPEYSYMTMLREVPLSVDVTVNVPEAATTPVMNPLRVERYVLVVTGKTV
jgi:hypothetical protein